MQNVYFAKIYPAQRKAAYAFVAVCLGPALVIYLFGSRCRYSFQVVSMVVMLDLRCASEQMQKAVAVAIHDKAERLLLRGSYHQKIGVLTHVQKTKKAQDTRCCFAASRRTLRYVQRVSKGPQDKSFLFFG